MPLPDRTDADFMGAALSMGRRGLGKTMPNPSVGCVIVKNGRILGRGRTADGGRPHAETQALAMAGKEARGATAYVTLEPCSHTGQTPPCASALIQAGIGRCVIALRDPDPRVAGRGVAMLKAAGIAVTEHICAQHAKDALAGYLCRTKTGRPRMTLKMATTLDGRIATRFGESRWITGPDARRWVHAMRATSDAVMVGIGTALADDPMLDVRGFGPVHHPIRVVIDRQGRLPPTSKLITTASHQPVWILNAPGTEGPEPTGVKRLEVPTGTDGRLNLSEGLQALGQAGVTSVLCEGGGQLAAGLLAADLVDEIALFCAGTLIGADGIPTLGALGLARLAEAPGFALNEVRRVEGDTLSVWRRDI